MNMYRNSDVDLRSVRHSLGVLPLDRHPVARLDRGNPTPEGYLRHNRSDGT